MTIALIKYEMNDHTAVLTLNRPNAANALSTDLLNELNEHISDIETNTLVRCVVITGAGEKAFCAGADLKERSHMTDEQVIASVETIGHTISNIEKLEIPVIAAMNGAAFGGGLELALACDFRIAALNASMGLTETSLAIIPGAGGTQRLPRLIGTGPAKRMIYKAQRINSDEALDIGLVEKVISDDRVLDTALDESKEITANGPVAVRQAKQAIDFGMQTDLTTGLKIEHLAYRHTIPTADRTEGLNAFKLKRKPEYKGK